MENVLGGTAILVQQAEGVRASLHSDFMAISVDGLSGKQLDNHLDSIRKKIRLVAPETAELIGGIAAWPTNLRHNLARAGLEELLTVPIPREGDECDSYLATGLLRGIQSALGSIGTKKCRSVTSLPFDLVRWIVRFVPEILAGGRRQRGELKHKIIARLEEQGCVPAAYREMVASKVVSVATSLG